MTAKEMLGKVDHTQLKAFGTGADGKIHVHQTLYG